MIRILRFKNLKYTRIFLHCKSMFFLIDINNIIIPITIRYKTSSNFRYYYFIVYYKNFLRTSTEYSYSRNTYYYSSYQISWFPSLGKPRSNLEYLHWKPMLAKILGKMKKHMWVSRLDMGYPHRFSNIVNQCLVNQCLTQVFQGQGSGNPLLYISVLKFIWL